MIFIVQLFCSFHRLYMYTTPLLGLTREINVTMCCSAVPLLPLCSAKMLNIPLFIFFFDRVDVHNAISFAYRSIFVASSSTTMILIELRVTLVPFRVPSSRPHRPRVPASFYYDSHTAWEWMYYISPQTTWDLLVGTWRLTETLCCSPCLYIDSNAECESYYL